MSEAFELALNARYEDKIASFAKRDGSFVDRFYALEAIAVAPGRDPLVGRAAIRGFYDTLLSGDMTATCQSWKRVQSSPLTGHDFATFTIVPAGAEPIPMKFLFLWKLIESHWMCDGYIYIRNERFS